MVKSICFDQNYITCILSTERVLKIVRIIIRCYIICTSNDACGFCHVFDDMYYCNSIYKTHSTYNAGLLLELNLKCNLIKKTYNMDPYLLKIKRKKMKNETEMPQ